jgi:hypothetical protein
VFKKRHKNAGRSTGDKVWVVVKADPSRSPDPIGFPTNEELMQMLILPVEDHLKRVIRLGNGAVVAHEQTTPDLRTDLLYPEIRS